MVRAEVILVIITIVKVIISILVTIIIITIIEIQMVIVVTLIIVKVYHYCLGGLQSFGHIRNKNTLPGSSKSHSCKENGN